MQVTRMEGEKSQNQGSHLAERQNGGRRGAIWTLVGHLGIIRDVDDELEVREHLGLVPPAADDFSEKVLHPTASGGEHAGLGRIQVTADDLVVHHRVGGLPSDHVLGDSVLPDFQVIPVHRLIAVITTIMKSRHRRINGGIVLLPLDLFFFKKAEREARLSFPAS